jgi:hypothetical protein
VFVVFVMYGFYEALRCIVWAVPEEDLETICALGMTCRRVHAYASARMAEIKQREGCSLRALRCYYRLRARYAYVPGQAVHADALHELGALERGVRMSGDYPQAEFVRVYEILRRGKRPRTKNDDLTRDALKVVVRDWEDLTRNRSGSGKKRRRKHFFY